MAPPPNATMNQWVITATDKGFDGLKYEEVPLPKPGDNEVLVKLYGASLNYRDLAILKGEYPFPLDLPAVACSDGAGDICEVGEKVTLWKEGDKVVTLFNQGHHYGELNSKSIRTSLGGIVDGTLRHFGVFHELGVVRAPANLNHLEASTLTCAGLTSWNALHGLRQIKPGDWVLTQGTGGVSLFALQFAKAAGAKVIATTSSVAKAERLKVLGADHVLNYEDTANWGDTARLLTPGDEGVDYIIEVGGKDTMPQSLKAIKYGGIINLIGFLSGMDSENSVLDALKHICTFRGIYVGSRAQMEDMVRAIEANDIHPVVDKKVFTISRAKEAYQYMWSRQHFGKVTIMID